MITDRAIADLYNLLTNVIYNKKNLQKVFLIEKDQSGAWERKKPHHVFLL